MGSTGFWHRGHFGWASGAPHPRQNRSPGLFTRPHRPQETMGEVDGGELEVGELGESRGAVPGIVLSAECGGAEDR